MSTITPMEALNGREYAIVKSRTREVYDLYRDEETAKRISADLNRRYGAGAYYPAKIVSEEEQ